MRRSRPLKTAGRIKTILIIDDDQALLDALGGACRRRWQDIEVLTAATGAGGLDMARGLRLDVALVDLNLPDIWGSDVVRALRRVHRRTLLIVLTGYGSVEDTVEVMRAGASDVLPKPVSPSELFARIAQHLSGQPIRADARHKITTPTMARAEWEHMRRVLADCNGNISEAARRLGLSRTTIHEMLAGPAPRR